MSKSWTIVRIAGALVLIGLLVAGGFALYNAAWSQGYMASAAAGSEAAQVAPPAYPQPVLYPGLYNLGLFLFPAVLLGLALMFGLRLIFMPLYRPWRRYPFHPRMMRHFHGPVHPAWQKRWEEYMKAEMGNDIAEENGA